MFGLEHSLIRLEARRAELPEGWHWTDGATPPLPEPRPWQQAGFFAEMWSRLNLWQPDGPQRLISTNDLNVVLAAGEGTKRVFFKMGRVVNSEGQIAIGQEACVTAALSLTQPELIPEVLSADPLSGQLITRYGGETLEKVGDLRAWTQAAEALAHFHRSAGVGGVVHHAFDDLLERGEALLRNGSALLEWGLEPEQIQELSEALPTLKRLWQQVKALNLPDGPVHGDSHTMNALWDGERVKWFDWSEAARGYPFLDMGWLLGHSARRTWPVHRAEPDLSFKLAQSYLRALGLPDAHAELSAALPLTFLHRAVVYDDTFRHWPAPRPQYVPMFLRLLAYSARNCANLC